LNFPWLDLSGVFSLSQEGCPYSRLVDVLTGFWPHDCDGSVLAASMNALNLNTVCFDVWLITMLVKNVVHIHIYMTS
jgi:hypothetical protein